MTSDLFFRFAEASGKLAFQFDPDKRQFLYLSSTAEELVGLSKKQICATPEILLTLLDSDEAQALTSKLLTLAAGRHLTATVRIKPAGQNQKRLKIDACLLPDTENNIAGIVQDVTKQVNYELYLLEYGRRKDSVLSIVAHDLKAPIAHIQSASGMLSKEQQIQNPEIAKLYQIIDQACADSIRLISDLLRDEHLNSEEIAPKKELLDVGQLLQRQLTPFIATDKLNHRFELVLPDHKVLAELDELKFMQIMNNLIINSVKFTPEGGLIRIEVKSDNNTVSIIHSDSGIGIPEDMMPHIFEAYKTGRLGLRGEPSSGVGLSVVRRLVELQAGTITVETSADAGTVFYLTFPIKDLAKS